MAWDKKRSLLVTEIDRATIINWVREKGEKLSDEPLDEEIPEITEIDELQQRDCTSCLRSSVPQAQTFVGCKQNKFWVWSGRECAQCLAPQGEMRKHRVNHK